MVYDDEGLEKDMARATKAQQRYKIAKALEHHLTVIMHYKP
jgi:hypothetical protein